MSVESPGRSEKELLCLLHQLDEFPALNSPPGIDMNLPDRQPLGTPTLPANRHHIREAAGSRALGKGSVLEQLQRDALKPPWKANLELRMIVHLDGVVESRLGEQDNLDFLFTSRELPSKCVSKVKHDAAM